MTSSSPPDQGHRRADYSVVVLGAGMSGLVSASILLDQKHERILVLEEYDRVGGNHISWNTDRYTFDIGSLIFQDDSPLLRHLPELLPLYVPVNPRVGRLNPQGIVTDYPFSLKHDILDRGPLEWVRITLSVMKSRLLRDKIRNAKDYAEYWIGARLLRQSGLEHYMTRFYGVPPDTIDATFARKRMYWIRDNASVLRRIRRWIRPSERPPQSQQLVRPREGFPRLYAAAVERLGTAGVEFGLGERLERVTREGGTFTISTSKRTMSAARLISTIPLDRMLHVCGLSGGEELPTVTLLSLFFSFGGQRGFEQSILYNFSHGGVWKRLTMYSDFYGLSGGREFFTVEVNFEAAGGSVAAAADDFRRHASANGLFVGDLTLEGNHTLTSAYPIYVDDAEARASEAIAKLGAFGVESFGRQGGFNYQPTARASAIEAEEALKPSQRPLSPPQR